MQLPAHRHAVGELLELFGGDELPKNFALDVFAVVQEFDDVRTGMEDVERIIG